MGLRTAEERAAILEAKIAHLQRRGYRVVGRTPNTAQLVQPKRFSFGFALLWLLVLGVGLIVYLLYYAGKRDKTVYLEVVDDGRLRISVNGHAPYWERAAG